MIPDSPRFKPLPRFRFTEQKLRTWRPILTHALAIFLAGVIGLLVLAAGVGIYLTISDLSEIKFRYDDLCDNDSDCIVPISIPHQMKGDIEFRYELTNFYQNHRRYGLSRAQLQLEGYYVNFEGMENCDPYRTVGLSDSPDDWILPCGIFAMSVFNDSFEWLANPSLFSASEIAFSGDREVFRPLSSEYHTGYKWLELNSSALMGQTDEHFIVWMRAGFLSTNLKLYSKCHDCVIEPGQYDIAVKNRYPSASFGGEKAIVITTVSVLGTKGMFLGIAYIATGLGCLVLSGMLIVCELVEPRELGERLRSRRVVNEEKG
jgi:hypothetical protein